MRGHSPSDVGFAYQCHVAAGAHGKYVGSGGGYLVHCADRGDVMVKQPKRAVTGAHNGLKD